MPRVHFYFRQDTDAFGDERSLAIQEKALGPEHPDVATSLENYAALLRETGRTAEADKMEARARKRWSFSLRTFGR